MRLCLPSLTIETIGRNLMPETTQVNNANIQTTSVVTSSPSCTDIVSPEHNFPEFPKEAYIGVLADFAELYSRHYESPKEFFYFDAIVVTATALSGRVRADFGDLEPY